MKIAELRQEFSRLQSEATGIVAVAETDNRELTADEKTGNETRFTRMTKIQSTIDEHERFASMALRGETPPKTTVQRTQEPDGRDEFAAGSEDGIEFNTLELETDAAAAKRFAQDKAGINRFLRTGDLRGLKFTTNSALTTGTGSGVLVPSNPAAPIVLKRIGNPIRAAHVARGLVPITTDISENIPLPIIDDTSNNATTRPKTPRVITKLS